VSLRDDLIRVFGSTPVEKVTLSSDYTKLQAKYAHDAENFNRHKQEVEEAKTLIELAFKLAGNDHAEQLKAAIWELLTRRRDADRDLFYELIVHGYRNRPDYWTVPQQQHFDRAWRLIQSKHDFFLSFSSRFEEVAGDNPVNTRYEHFIRKEISDAEYEKADRKKTNLLALAIHRLLSDAQHLGFFFPHSQGDNKDVKEKLTNACQGSVVFVQVLQNILFVAPVPPQESPDTIMENYCFFEYRTAIEAYGETAEGRMHTLFIGAEDAYANLVKPYHVPPQYKAWYQHVSDKDVPYLEGTHKFDPDKIEALRQIVLTKLKPRLDEVWDRLLTTVPS